MRWGAGARGRPILRAVHSHAHRALEAGASAGEVEHTVLLAVTTLGFPAMMTALAWGQAAIAGHEA